MTYNGNRYFYLKNAQGDVTGLVNASGTQVVSYTYDANSNLGQLTDGISGRVNRYSYDFLDRLMRYEESGDGYSNIVQWGYDDENNLSSQTQTLNGSTYASTYAYDKDNRLTKATEGAISANYTYDSFSRMTGLTAKNGSTSVVNTAVTYVDPSSSATSTQVKIWNNGKAAYTYTYDNKGNITSITGGGQEFEYRYDKYGRLISAEDYPGGYVWTYTYDDGGNITQRGLTDYYNNKNPNSILATYTYGNADWPDLLTAFNGKSITYDAIGNPLNDGTWTYTWQHGRQLASMSKSGSSITYGYNADGKRISKTVNGTTYNYSYLGDQLTEMTWGSNKLHFTYDSTGPASVTYNGNRYFYLKNAQGDVTGLVNASGTQVVSYTYDPWGAPMSTDGTMASTLGAANPLRYRGYVYDTETGLYYLSSRYYNPVWGRFINADGYASTGQGFDGNNMFAYCNGNPLRYRDSSGMLPRNTMTMMTDTGGGKIAFLTMFNYALNPYITDSNIYGSLITGLDSGREGLTNYCVGSIKQDPCPPNIGIGIFEKQRQAELSNIRSVNAGFQKAFSVMAYGSALIDVGVGVRNNLASDAPFKKVAIDATVDAVYSGGAVFISAKAGALIGGCIGGPVGAFVGIFAGYLTGIGLYYLTDLMYVDGKNIRTWQKEYLYLW